jgi:hypothetical protein
MGRIGERPKRLLMSDMGNDSYGVKSPLKK